MPNNELVSVVLRDGTIVTGHYREMTPPSNAEKLLAILKRMTEDLEVLARV